MTVSQVKEQLKRTMFSMTTDIRELRLTIRAKDKKELCGKTGQFYEMVQEMMIETNYSYVIRSYMNRKWSDSESEYDSEWSLIVVKTDESYL